MGRISKRKKPIFAINATARAKLLGMKGHDLAEATGLAYPTVRDIMAGVSHGLEENKFAIAKALNMTVSDLYAESPKPKEPPTSDLFREAVSILATLDERQLRRTLEFVKGAKSKGSVGQINAKKNKGIS